ncbi:hypothetical protein BDQ17DRAFT_1377601 [Cyathus striatus]|nr:hypothetical protein BDQ17DRAFT_1377601 [Cyathus striatus]
MKMRHRKLEVMEINACYEVAAQTLRVLNDFIFDSSMPATLRWEAETNEINNISQIFTPGVNRHLKLKFLSRLAPNLQVIARIMANAFRKFAIGRNQYHCRVSRALGLDLVKKKFALSEELVKRVHEYIDSDPKYKGDSVFPADDSRDETGIYQIRENIDRLNCSLQKYNLIRSRNILELWEMNFS